MRADGIKDYIYISETKVKSYVDQFDQGLLTRFVRAVAVGIGPVTIRIERPLEASLIEELARVTKTIHQSNTVGTIDKPAEYIEGSIPMLWGFLDANLQTGDGLVFFAGRTPETWIVLAGSLANVVGGTRGNPNSRVNYTRVLEPYIETAVGSGLIPKINLIADSPMTLAVAGVSNHVTKNLGYFEFFAKRLHEGFVKQPDSNQLQQRFLFGSPLYVARWKSPDSSQSQSFDLNMLKSASIPQFPIKCTRCHKINRPGARHCRFCQWLLD